MYALLTLRVPVLTGEIMHADLIAFEKTIKDDIVAYLTTKATEGIKIELTDLSIEEDDEDQEDEDDGEDGGAEEEDEDDEAEQP